MDFGQKNRKSLEVKVLNSVIDPKERKTPIQQNEQNAKMGRKGHFFQGGTKPQILWRKITEPKFTGPHDRKREILKKRNGEN